MDLERLKKDVEVLRVPVAHGDVITDPDALVRVVNDVPKLVEYIEAIPQTTRLWLDIRFSRTYMP